MIRSGPSFLKLVVCVAISGLAALGALTIGLNRRLCEERVRTREDGRSVWLYLVAREPDRRDDPDVVQFIDYLDSRLPSLECDVWGGSQPEDS